MDTKVILATDASFAPAHKVTGYAFWIQKSEQKPWRQSGVATRIARNSTEAELIALANGLYALGMAKKPASFKLVIYMDNKGAMQHANPEIEPDTRGARRFQRDNEDIVSYCRNALQSYDFQFVHTKAHSMRKGNTGAHYNSWCDKASRAEMHKALLAQSIQKY